MRRAPSFEPSADQPKKGGQKGGLLVTKQYYGRKRRLSLDDP